MNAEFDTFDDAASAALEFLQARYGFALWMVTRVRQDCWVVLSAADRGVGVKAGDNFKWSDSIFARMISTDGPRIAQRREEVPAYVDAPIRSRLDIKSYIGVPLQTPGGRFFGTLCAIDNAEHPEVTASELPLLELVGGLLAGYIRTRIESSDLDRRNERFRFEGMTDALTHLPNRRAWEEKIEKEQHRSRRLGDTTFISIIDVYELKEINERKSRADGEQLLRNTALALRYAVRNSDFIARVGDDKFAILGIQCDSIDPDEVSRRLRSSLQSAGISASVGTASGRPSDTHREVWETAKAAMSRNDKTGKEDGRQYLHVH